MNQSIAHPGYYAVARSGPRPLGKTLLVCLLLMLIPIVGWSMATMYWVTRRTPERYDAGAAAGAAVALILMVVGTYVLLVIGWVLVANQSMETGAPSFPRTTGRAVETDLAPFSGPSRTSGVSLAEFNSLREGMSLGEVVGILGSSGEVVSSNDLAGIKTVMYQWDGNTAYGNMNAMFQNGEMISKAQFGLE